MPIPKSTAFGGVFSDDIPVDFLRIPGRDYSLLRRIMSEQLFRFRVCAFLIGIFQHPRPNFLFDAEQFRLEYDLIRRYPLDVEELGDFGSELLREQVVRGSVAKHGTKVAIDVGHHQIDISLREIVE